MDLELAGRVIVVTGGSSGIGLATAELLLHDDANVAICGRDDARLAAAAEQLGHPDRLLVQQGDVLSAADMTGLATAVAGRWGRVDGLVNNAGQSRMSTYTNTTDDAWREELDLKFFGLLNPVRAFENQLRASPAASIVNINAVLSRQPEGRLVATSAARAGALNLTKSLSVELAPDIRVNAVLLGLIDTGQWRRRYEAAQTEAAQSKTQQPLSYEAWCAELAADRGIPLGRLGRAEEVAPLIATLLSPRAGYTTGSTVEVAGGVSRSV